MLARRKPRVPCKPTQRPSRRVTGLSLSLGRPLSRGRAVGFCLGVASFSLGGQEKGVHSEAFFPGCFFSGACRFSGQSLSWPSVSARFGLSGAAWRVVLSLFFAQGRWPKNRAILGTPSALHKNEDYARSSYLEVLIVVKVLLPAFPL